MVTFTDLQTVYKVDLDRMFVYASYDDKSGNEEGEDDMTNQLYEFEVNGEKQYGFHLATNSKGLWVMEVKGTGQTVEVKKETVEEVTPYTVDIMFADRFGDRGGAVHSYTTIEGKFNEDDFLLMVTRFGSFTLARVVKVNTKSKKATEELKPIARLLVDTEFKF